MSTKKHILVLTYWPLSEALIQSYTLPYLHKILKVSGGDTIITLVTLEKTKATPVIISHNIRHLPIQADLFSVRKAFRWFSIFKSLTKFSRVNNVTHLHGWCMPGAVIAWRISKRTGIPFIIDSFEPHAEAMAENGTWKRSSIKFKLLFYLEKRVSRAADTLIAISPFMQEYAKMKYGVNKEMFIKPACTDLEQFQPLISKKHGEIICVYAGKLGGIYFEDEVFRLIKICADRWENKFRFLLLGNYTDTYIADKCKAAGCPQNVIEHRFVPHHEIPAWLGKGTFGLTPVKPVPTKKCCSPIKNGEYWACGLPVLITKNISIDSDLIADNRCGAVLEDMSTDSIQRALSLLDVILAEEPSVLVQRCRKLATENRNYIIAENIYQEIYK